MKVYLIEHIWSYTDPDGNPCQDSAIVTAAPTKELADKYVELYSKQELYGFEWEWKWCHLLRILEFDTDKFDLEANPWIGDKFESGIAKMRKKYGEEFTTNKDAWYECE